ncbi:DUF4365 domain-containing protein [Siminovitchia acidinfaciens]|uniref:DUF4365 domain-containing protein n=1 Tax=Siminovitchia acidinfaciens TaxID=2321395 RepID=A0A429Y417_9BACI|nr:DUF4365 domain-containing protein [Siminovitchia acidinfaciens]RST76176.1 DUF4365 domain-containing protein [Siminovitchia acidinfaciens]
MKLPKAISQTERIGVNMVNEIITRDLGWIFREQPTDDYGIDAQIEIVDENLVTGKLIAVQIKTGESYFTSSNEQEFTFRGKIEHLNYWSNHSLPVVLILCDPNENICYWTQVSEGSVEKTSINYWKTPVPKRNILGTKASESLRRIAENKTVYEQRLNSLGLDRAWMKEIEAGNKLILESEEWVNKSSGRGSISLKVIDPWTEIEKIIVDWPIAFFPMQSYEDVFVKLFPWADISVDDEFYEEYDEQEFLLDYGVWDKEDGKYYTFGDWDEWKNSLPKIRPFKVVSGEVAAYRLVLNLNDIGKAFLKLDSYLRKGIEPLTEKPDEPDISIF